MLAKMLTCHLLKREHKTLLALTGSIAGVAPLPGLTLYSATKGFVQYLVESLAYEVHGSNLDITSYTPMDVDSDMVTMQQKTDAPFFDTITVISV